MTKKVSLSTIEEMSGKPDDLTVLISLHSFSPCAKLAENSGQEHVVFASQFLGIRPLQPVKENCRSNPHNICIDPIVNSWSIVISFSEVTFGYPHAHQYQDFPSIQLDFPSLPIINTWCTNCEGFPSRHHLLN